MSGVWKRMTALDRVMTRVDKRPDGHWIWTGSRAGLHREYGQVMLDGARTGVHRAVWTLLRGPIPDGLDVLHQCGQTLCVNPDHVRLGTHAENLAEAVAVRGGVHWNPKGEAHPRARLTWDQVRDIRARAANGEWVSTLGREFGISQSAASNIVAGLRWADPEYVPPPSRYRKVAA